MHNREKGYVNAENKRSKAKRDAFIKNRRKQLGRNLSFGASEAYKLLRTNLEFSVADEGKCKVIGVTSALRGEGKSTTSVNLAYMMAEGGKKVLFVEADMRIPVLNTVLGLGAKAGLSHALAGICSWNDAVCESKLHENLLVVTAGEIPPNPAELLSSKKMEQLIEEMSSGFDYLIIDLPPVNLVSDAVAVSKLLSGMVIVVRQNYCDRLALAEAMRRLEQVDTKLLGFVLNDAELPTTRYKKYRIKHRSDAGYRADITTPTQKSQSM